MLNLNVGLGLALCITNPVLGANTDVTFYDENQDDWAAAEGLSNAILTMDTTNNCLHYSSGHGPSNVAFSCNGKCKSNLYTNKRNVLPNGSYYKNQQGTVYTCTVDGWVECGVNASNSSELLNPLEFFLYDGDESADATGYKRFSIRREYDVLDPAYFCSAPYDNMNLWNISGVFGAAASNARAFVNRYTDSQGRTITEYSYTGCASGYYLKDYGTTATTRGTRCEKCPYVANGQATTTNWNTSKACSITCDTGYKPSADGKCVQGNSNQYDAGLYGGASGDFRSCPSASGAVCDGEWIYCPAGNYVYTQWDGKATCKDCPGEWGTVGETYSGPAQRCNGDSDDWAKGIATDCLYTDVIYEDDTGCYEYRGIDDKGTYEYRDRNGKLTNCYYD